MVQSSLDIDKIKGLRNQMPSLKANAVDTVSPNALVATKFELWRVSTMELDAMIDGICDFQVWKIVEPELSKNGLLAALDKLEFILDLLLSATERLARYTEQGIETKRLMKALQRFELNRVNYKLTGRESIQQVVTELDKAIDPKQATLCREVKRKLHIHDKEPRTKEEIEWSIAYIDTYLTEYFASRGIKEEALV